MSFLDDKAINFPILENPSHPEFIRQLKFSTYRVSTSQLTNFFKILLNHFNFRIHSKIGNEILLSICKILSINEESISIFIQAHYSLMLPFGQKEFRLQLLDLLFILVKKNPETFIESLSIKFSTLVPFEPKKCLIIISIFSQNFENLREPFPMIDILFRQSDYFRSIECADDYISLLIWLLQKSPTFRKQRIQHCWTYVCDMLNLSNIAILNTCYYGLCKISEVDKDSIKELGYPVSAVAKHILRRPLRNAVMSLLMRYPPSSDTRHMIDLLLSLIKVSEEDNKAILLLMGLSMDGMNALLLLQNPEWMIKPLPQTLDTMKLFCILLLHPELREVLIKPDITIDFFKSLLSINSIGISSAISTIMRKLPLTQDFIGKLSDSGFLGLYFSTVLEHEDEEILLSALRLLDTIARIRYVRELSEMVDTLVRLIKESNNLSTAAASVSIDLCKYPKCAKLFKSKRLNEYFKQPISDPKMKKYANRFLQVLNKVENH